MSTQQSVLFDAPGPRARRVIMIGNVVGGIVVLGVAALVLLALGRKGQLDADLWTSLFTADAWQYYFIPGLQNTLRAAGFAIVGALVFGLVFGTGRLSQLRAVRVVSGIVVEFFRAVPVLLMMIFFYLLLGFNKVDDAPFLAVVFALVLYNGSVIAELVRSGVGNLPKGQGEAGLAIGLTPSQTLRSIQLPRRSSRCCRPSCRSSSSSSRTPRWGRSSRTTSSCAPRSSSASATGTSSSRSSWPR